MQFKKKILSWVQNFVSGSKYNLEVPNLHRAFKNGMVFAAIVHRLNPKLFDYSKLKPENAKENLELAFNTAEKFGVDALLDAEDILDFDRPDDKIVSLYLSSLYKYYLKNKRSSLPIFSETKKKVLENKIKNRQSVAVKMRKPVKIKRSTSKSNVGNLNSKKSTMKRSNSKKRLSTKLKRSNSKKRLSAEIKKSDIKLKRSNSKKKLTIKSENKKLKRSNSKKRLSAAIKTNIFSDKKLRRSNSKKRLSAAIKTNIFKDKKKVKLERANSKKKIKKSILTEPKKTRTKKRGKKKILLEDVLNLPLKRESINIQGGILDLSFKNNPKKRESINIHGGLLNLNLNNDKVYPKKRESINIHGGLLDLNTGKSKSKKEELNFGNSSLLNLSGMDSKPVLKKKIIFNKKVKKKRRKKKKKVTKDYSYLTNQIIESSDPDLIKKKKTQLKRTGSKSKLKRTNSKSKLKRANSKKKIKILNNNFFTKPNKDLSQVNVRNVLRKTSSRSKLNTSMKLKEKAKRPKMQRKKSKSKLSSMSKLKKRKSRSNLKSMGNVDSIFKPKLETKKSKSKIGGYRSKSMRPMKKKSKIKFDKSKKMFEDSFSNKKQQYRTQKEEISKDEIENTLSGLIKKYRNQDNKRIGITKLCLYYKLHSKSDWDNSTFGTASSFIKKSQKFIFHKVTAGKHECSLKE